jgi:hypothetical protein
LGKVVDLQRILGKLRQGELSRFQYKATIDFDLRCADQEVTAWGAMAMIKRMLNHLGLDAA